MPDDAPLLHGAGKPGTSTKVTSGTLKTSQVLMNRAALTGVDVQAPRQHAGLIPNDPDGLAT